MKLSWHPFHLLNVIIIYALFENICNAETVKKKVVVLSEKNWTDMLNGEWLVEFYAPWCPACKALEKDWEKVASWQDDLSIRVAKIDVTENPSLSGRFFVTALPTIYHVKAGEFRQYKGPRDEQSIISFVDDGKWKDLSPTSWYSSPQSPHMAVVGWFFKASMAIRDLHNQMTEEYGIPVWGSYIVFAIFTIFVGLILGLCLVCACDYCCPAVPLPREPTTYSRVDPDQQRPPYEQNGAAHESGEDEGGEETSAVGGDRRPGTARKRPQKVS